MTDMEGSSRSPEGVASSDVYQFRLPGFEGPLDLLLHLVRVHELDILDLPIVEVARQYQACLDLMRQMNLEIAGEYLVMAATLLHIKSRMLLPPDPSPGEDGTATEDPRAELAQQLLEYQKYRHAAENLQAIDSVRSLIWTREGRVPDDFAGEEVLVVDLYDMMSAFRKLLSRLGEEARIQLRRDDVSVADKIHWLAALLEERGSVDLLALFVELPDRLQRIATFLAVLEMVRLQMIVAYQRRHLEEIRIALRTDSPTGGDATSASEETP